MQKSDIWPSFTLILNCIPIFGFHIPQSGSQGGSLGFGLTWYLITSIPELHSIFQHKSGQIVSLDSRVTQPGTVTLTLRQPMPESPLTLSGPSLPGLPEPDISRSLRSGLALIMAPGAWVWGPMVWCAVSQGMVTTSESVSVLTPGASLRN